MKYSIHTLLLGTMVLIPFAANASSLTAQTDTNTYAMAQNLSTAELNAIKDGRLTNNGQTIPVETQIMMSTGNLDSYTISKIQQSLTERGFYKGTITGNWDNQTSVALQSFQRSNGQKIDETGTLISSTTLAGLGVSMDKLTAGDGARLSGDYNAQSTPAAAARPNVSPSSSYSPYSSSTVKTLGTVQIAANEKLDTSQPVGSHVSKTQITPPGKTVAAPDNGSKATMTRDAVASGKFNETIDGSPARGTTDGTALQNNTTANNPTAGIATRSNPVTSGSSVVGNSNLSAGSTSSASVQTTGSLQATAAPQAAGTAGSGTASNNVDGRNTPGSPPTTSSAVGGRAAGSLSNSTSLSATGSTAGIANSGGSLSDGAGSGTTRSSGLAGGGSSGASAGTGSLSSSGGGSAGGGGGL